MTEHSIGARGRVDPSAPRLTRRQVVISAAAAGAALGGLKVLHPVGTDAQRAAPASMSGTSVLAGVIARIDAQDTLQLRVQDGTRTVKILGNAAIYRAASAVDGEAAFTAGEEVVAEGTSTGTIFAATALHTMHRVVEARVVARAGQQVQTDRDVIMLTAETRARDSFAGHALPPEKVVPGAEIAVLGRTDPRTGALVAELISDRSHGSRA